MTFAKPLNYTNEESNVTFTSKSISTDDFSVERMQVRICLKEEGLAFVSAEHLMLDSENIMSLPKKK